MLPNPRVAALSGRATTRPSLTPRNSSIRRDEANHSPLAPETGPLRPRAFLAEDLINRLYVCLLSPNRRLICLRVQSTDRSVGAEGDGDGDDDDDGDEAGLTLDPHASYLPAVDAVYVPQSRMTVCLEASKSIILYSGITRVCVLGVVPALFSPLPPVGLHPSSLRPLTVRPPSSVVALSTAKAKITELLSVITNGEPNSGFSESRFEANLAAATSHLALVPVASCEAKSFATWRLCLPAGRQFTLAFMRRPNVDFEDVSAAPESQTPVCERELQIQLPVLASNTLDCKSQALELTRFVIGWMCSASFLSVRHCLDAFRCVLPCDVTLHLLTSWFRHRNPPTGDVGTGELPSFARFILMTFGLVPEGGSAPASPIETGSGDLKRLRARKNESSDTPDDVKMELLGGLEAPGSDFAVGLRVRDLPRWKAVQHLPDVLFCLHMVFENDHLNVFLADQIKVLAILNHILARYARFSSYVEYYSMSGVSTLTPSGLYSIPRLPTEVAQCLVWSPHVRASHQSAPSLSRWCVSTLSTRGSAPYVHVVGVNDTAAALASLVLSMSQRVTVEADGDAFRHAVRLWTERIEPIGYEEGKRRDPAGVIATSGTDSTPGKVESLAFVIGYVVFFVSFVDFVKAAAQNPILLAFATAFVKAEDGRSHQQSESSLPYQRAVLFLSELGMQLTNRLAQLPPAYTCILQTALAACQASPPTNCAPEIYRLIGRRDLARQFEIMRCSGALLSQSSATTRSHLPHILCSRSLEPRRQEGNQDLCQAWSPAERWASIVLPILTTPSSANRDGCVGSAYTSMLASRHFLLTTLENNPACQVSFEDLRLQEAYKLVQTSSHIWLPRICTDESTFGPPIFPHSTNTETSPGAAAANIAKARLDMHLAAACQRTSALPLGRGMLGLGSLVASPPPLLPVYPLCLRGRAVVSPLSGLPVHQDLARGSLAETGRASAEVIGGSAASDHPGNASALAVIAAVVASGCASSLGTACSLSRLLQPSDANGVGANEGGGAGAGGGGGGGGSGSALRRLAALASNATLSAASAVSSNNILHTPAVLAARHWPDFHNGVAAGLMISPHASIDATWIVQNCKAIALGGATSAAVLNSTPPSACPYSPTQAGFLYGLGLNGHLNKLSPQYIREFTVQVHDLSNAAVILGKYLRQVVDASSTPTLVIRIGLCAGKRGTMDQATLRLLAVHYRPLLLPEPVLIEMSVPSICQAASAFGLGLLFLGSAHRHIASILLAELGKPLGSTSNGCVSANAGSSNDRSTAGGGGGGTNTNDTSTPDASSNGQKTACAGGTGGFAGDSRELLSLSAGLALGLVLLQRGDSPCGLSDLAVANTLYAYMTGGRRDSTLYSLDACYDGPGQTVDALCINIPRPPPGHPLPQFLQPHLLAVPGRSRVLTKKLHRETSFLTTPEDTSSIPIEELADLGVPTGTAASAATYTVPPIETSRLLAAVDPLESIIQECGGVNLTSEIGTAENPVPAPAVPLRGSTATHHHRLPPIGAASQSNHSQQIRERDAYNSDVSAPGAIIALGFIYLGTGSETVSKWLQAPNTHRELESVRPDLLALRTIAWGLVNFDKVEATADWIQARVPACILSVLTPRPPKEEGIAKVEGAEDPASPLVMSTETDVENRQPRGRTLSGTSCLGRRQPRRQPLSPKLPIIHAYNSFTLPDASTSPLIDYSTISLSYLNILVGACFAIGLKYAGTCDPNATELLHKITISFLSGDWWPPNHTSSTEKRDSLTEAASSSTGQQSSFITSASTPPKLTDLPPMEQAVRHAAATCLLSLAMVLAGSGNLTVLRLVRKLRAIRLFGRFHKTAASTSSKGWPSSAETGRLFQVAATAAQAALNVQTLPTGSPGNLPVSTAAILGSVLAPDFTLQMIYSSVVGLLFLGGGRLTLSNTPEAAALLTVAFFPRYPVYAGDNWYHLQCLRHLYVLATKPRRLCGVNALTNQVEPVTLKCWYKDRPDCIVSKQTAVFPSDFWEHGSSIQLSCGKVSTVFDRGTIEWKLLKKSLDEAGYFFVCKEPFPRPYAHFEKITENCLANWTQPACMWQLRLIAAFLTSEFLGQEAQNQPLCRLSNVFGSSGVLAHAVATRLIHQFGMHAQDIQMGLRVYFFGSLSEKLALSPEVRAKTLAFRIWFCIPTAQQLRPLLPNPTGDRCVSLPEFLMAIRPTKDSLDPQAPYWLHRFLYTRL
ncbi:unnamed protein product [Mesocestoides corti]|uniref:Anaphase-promoting complex subunit 1 middle domain-containing protein n=1 Tax=Mesocestoides corti TaxID=53468 RepID=A0A3P6G8U1_MESCO|nr:unnamed protein product [Mesocestoides corti]